MIAKVRVTVTTLEGEILEQQEFWDTESRQDEKRNSIEIAKEVISTLENYYVTNEG